MKNFLMIVNLLCIVGLIATLVWSGFAIGRHEEFRERMNAVFVFQGICLIFMVVRRFRKL